MANLLNIGVTGLTAAQYGMATTQHNIANVNTTGYSRQQVNQATNIAIATGSGYLGQGVSVTSVKRVYDQFLTAQINKAQTQASAYDAYGSEVSQIDSMLADSTSGLTPAVQDFFKGVQDLSANASQLSARQSMVSTAQALTTRFSSMDGQLKQLYGQVNSEIESSVSEINTYSKQIGDLNQRIKLAEAATNQPANDLLDQRDQLITDLSKRINITTYTDSNGDFNVFTGSGQQLVVGQNSRNLKAVQSTTDASKLTVALEGINGNPDEQLPESMITGGTLGGVMKFRSETLDKTSNQLGQVAVSMALTLNAQQALGQDLNGASALSGTGFQSSFFNIGTPTVVSNSGNAATTPIPTVNFAAATLNSSGTNYQTSLTGSDYKLTMNSGSSFTLTRLSDNASWNATNLSGLNQDGLSFTDLTAAQQATVTAGNSFLIEPTRGQASNISVNSVIAGDVSKIAAASPVRAKSAPTTGTVNNGTMTMSASVGPGYSTALSGSISASSSISVNYNSGSGNLTFSSIPAGTTLYATYASGTAASVATSPAVALASGGQTLTQLSLRDASGNTVLKLDVTGTPANGDNFSIQLNSGAVSDNSNALKIAKLQTQSTMNGGTSTYQGAYAQLVSTVGNTTKQVQVSGEAQTALLEQTQATRDSLAGVNLDEEAANLIKYQQAYQASAKMLSMGSELFNSLLQAMG